MKNIWKKYRSFWLISAEAVALGLFIFLIIIPAVDDIKNKSNNIQEEITNNEIDQMRLGKISEMEATYSSIQEKKSSLDVILGADQEVDFIKELENIAKDTGNGITLKVVDDNTNSAPAKSKNTTAKDKDKEAEKNIKDSLAYDRYITLQINLSGNYTNLVNFIKKLENTSYYVNIISLDVKKQKEEIKKENISNPSQVSIFGSSGTNQSNAQISDTKEKLVSNLTAIIYIKK